MYDIAPPQYSKKLIIKNQKISDIIAEIQDAFTDGVHVQVQNFSKQFTPTVSSLRRLWSWEKRNIKYIEDGDIQMVKEPARLYADRAGDCKSKTLFIGSVLLNIGCDVLVKYVNYPDIGTNHVYATAILPSGENVIIDTVWNSFNEEKRPYKLIKEQIFKAKNMPLYRMGATLRDSEFYTTSQDAQREALAIQNLDYINDLVKDIPDSVLENDVTEMSKTEFLSFMGVNVQGLVYDSTPAFTLPIILERGEIIGSIFSKIGDAIKNAWKKILNFIMKGGIQKAAPALIYAFVNTSISPKVDAKVAKAKQVVEYLAKKTGTDISTMRKTIAAAIQAKTGKTHNAELNDYFKKTVSGTGEKVGIAFAAIIAAAPAVLEIINKIIAFFKKNDAPDVGGAIPEAGDYTPPPFVDAGSEAGTPPATNTPPVIVINPNNPYDAPQSGGGQIPAPQSGGGGLNDMLPLILGAGLLYVMSNR